MKRCFANRRLGWISILYYPCFHYYLCAGFLSFLPWLQPKISRVFRKYCFVFQEKNKTVIHQPRSVRIGKNWRCSLCVPSEVHGKFFKFLLSLNSLKSLRYKENNTKERDLTWKPRCYVRILITRTWPIRKPLRCVTLEVCRVGQKMML